MLIKVFTPFIKAKSEKIIVTFWALFMPLAITTALSSFMDQPYNLFGGIVYLGLLSLLYREIGGSRFKTFKVIAYFVLFLFLISLGGWADQGIR